MVALAGHRPPPAITNRGHPPGDAKGVLRALGARVAAPVTGVRGAPPPRTGSPGAVVSWGGVFAASGAAPRRAAARGYSAHDAINAIKTHRANIQCGKRTSVVGPWRERPQPHSTTSCTTEQPVSRGACKASEESQVAAKERKRAARCRCATRLMSRASVAAEQQAAADS